jgi:hypothetical protein
MVIQNSIKLLNDISKIEEEISQLESIFPSVETGIDSEKFLAQILKIYCREA